jgi:hypothetical protein
VRSVGSIPTARTIAMKLSSLATLVPPGGLIDTRGTRFGRVLT